MRSQKKSDLSKVTGLKAEEPQTGWLLGLYFWSLYYTDSKSMQKQKDFENTQQTTLRIVTA